MIGFYCISILLSTHRSSLISSDDLVTIDICRVSFDAITIHETQPGFTTSVISLVSDVLHKLFDYSEDSYLVFKKLANDHTAFFLKNISILINIIKSNKNLQIAVHILKVKA
jgi:hypothetical protein